MTKIMVISCAVSMSVMAMGCGTTFGETYHFRAVGDNTNNYYRVVIKGHSWFSQSQYASGLYDKTAVDSLFGELQGASITVTSGLGGTQRPESERTGDTGSGNDTADSSASESTSSAPVASLESLDGTPIVDQRLVLFLSANSNAIVNQIRAFVRNEQMQNSMVKMIVKDDARRLEEARGKARPAQARADKLAAELDAVAATIEANSSFAQNAANTALQQALTALSRASASPDPSLPFPNVGAARTWLQDNPAAFEEGQ